jgi:hypothetical protein
MPIPTSPSCNKRSAPRDWAVVAAELQLENNPDRIITLAQELNAALAIEQKKAQKQQSIANPSPDSVSD